MFVIGMMSMQTYQNKHVCRIITGYGFLENFEEGGGEVHVTPNPRGRA